jgi:uncharacterized protein YbaA (DUF1428 family)
MDYVDGFVAAVKTARREEYRAFNERILPMFKEYGALQVVECWGDDVPEGEVTSFSMAVKREADESVVFSWVTWPSKEVRDAAWVKIIEDERMAGDMPLDGKRLIHGGFQLIVDG